MSNILSIALSGMQASSLRVSNSANNIANAQSTSVVKDGKVVNEPFMPQDVVQVSDVNGGTIAYTKSSGKAPVSLYDPNVGTVQMPNIDLAEELVKMQEASIQYQSNLKMISSGKLLLGTLVNMSS